MRAPWTSPFILTFLLISFLVGCNSSSIYQNPTSPSATPTAWRDATVTPTGGTFGFSDIGISLTFPPDAIPLGELFTFSVRAFPSSVPLTPSGPIYVRLGSFELVGNDISFQEPVTVSFPLVDYKSPGYTGRGFMLGPAYSWTEFGNAPIQADGMHAVMSISGPGIYGVFEPIPLSVEITVSRQSGPAPLSVAFKAIVTGGTPPYEAIWIWGDDADPDAGLTFSHFYEAPGDYDPSVYVIDATGSSATDWIHLTCYAQAGPPSL